MKETKTLIAFLKRCKKFADNNISTSDLIVEGEITVADLNNVLDSTVGGLIAGIHNDVAEIQRKMIDHYTKEGNKKMIKKLSKI